jgi:ethanolamine ammonia-lyase small subunit
MADSSSVDAKSLPSVASPPTDLPELIRAIRARTPARVLVGRAGPAYRTATQLELRQDHAAAVDAVHAELDVDRDFDRVFVQQWRLFQVQTCAASKTEYLLRPNLGRQFSDGTRTEILRHGVAGLDMQVAIGDGLSAAAVTAQVPRLLLLLENEARARGWSFGRPFIIRYCRVGVLNEIGELLNPAVVVLLIGERPGLATAESLSAYLAYRPRPGHSDAQRNLISNIHARGVLPESAARRIMNLAAKMRAYGASGVAIKEDLPNMDATSGLLFPANPSPLPDNS